MTKSLPRFLVALAVLGVSFVGILAFGIFAWCTNESFSRRKHAAEIEQAFNARLIPAAGYIRNFVEREHRLPSDEEMQKAGWNVRQGLATDNAIVIYRERPIWHESWGVNGRDFLLETEVPDWVLGYQSWDNKRIEGNME